MLEVQGIETGYGDLRILFDLSFTAEAGQITCIAGRNGAGKTTLMKAIMGLVPLGAGRITLDKAPLSTLPAHKIARERIGYIPQGRRLFTELTVAENIEIGLMVRGAGRDVRERVLDIFPRLRERLNQRAETLSGGEQQMLATARALCVEPRVLVLDEPTEGLQPSMIDQIRQVVLRKRNEGVAVILVEQRVDAILSLADKVVFIENGRNLETVTGATLQEKPEIVARHLGV
ncbi:MAG: ABC transporter ATP-binding protein [Pikeienuella sp.]